MFRVILRQMRVYQWVKNILIFVPLLTAHQFFSVQQWLHCIVAFFSFSFIASFIYILNDIIDLEADRAHPQKRNRPLASGQLTTNSALSIMVTLGLIGGLIALYVGPPFMMMLLFYFIVTVLYSLRLKREPILDVVILAGLYTLRIYAGSVAANVPVSQWLLSFSVFFFFGLAMVKRLTEILRIEGTSAARGYLAKDQNVILALGTSGQMLSLVILALYLNSPASAALYRQPEVLWLTTPLLFYWISRLWLLCARGNMNDDPIVFALKDPQSWTVFVLFMAVFLWAI